MDYPPTQAIHPIMNTYRPYVDSSASEDASSIHGEDEAFLEKQQLPETSHRRRKSSWRNCCSRTISSIFNPAVISCVFSIFTAGILVLVLLALTGKQQRPIKAILHSSSLLSGSAASKDAVGTKYWHCGKTPAEARELGCAFDIMSFAWTPPACYDHAASQATIKKTGPWIFYLDHNATQPIPDNLDALSNETIVWTEHSYHISHCTYAWERLHKAYLDETSSRLVPSELGSINHTLHCIGLVNDEQSPKKTVNAIAYMVFDSCTNLN